MQQNRKLPSQEDDFDNDVRLGEAVGIEKQNVVVNNVRVDQNFTVFITDGVQRTNEKTVIFHTLRRCSTEGINREMGSFVLTVEDGTGRRF